MLGWAAGLLVIALVAAVFGFTALAGAATGVAQVIFWIFIALFAIAVVVRIIRGKPPT
jgi:uncharacterized membrane protein YtjA (UPF0391 family)